MSIATENNPVVVPADRPHKPRCVLREEQLRKARTLSLSLSLSSLCACLAEAAA